MKNIKEWGSANKPEKKATHFKVFQKNNYQVVCLNDGTVIPAQLGNKTTSEASKTPQVEVRCIITTGKTKHLDAIELRNGRLFLGEKELTEIEKFTVEFTANEMDILTFKVECELMDSII